MIRVENPVTDSQARGDEGNCHNLAVPVLDKSMSAIAVDGQTARGPQEAVRRGGREREKRVSVKRQE